MEDREFGNLIGSDKVEGTAVYGADQTKIRAIKRIREVASRKFFKHGPSLRERLKEIAARGSSAPENVRVKLCHRARRRRQQEALETCDGRP